LIDGLQDITKSLVTVADQSGMMRKGITKIKNIETLSLVAEVCEADHPYLSGVASMRADSVSMATTIRRGIETWTDSIDTGQGVDLGSTDLESLTITELKHRLLQLMQERNSAIAHDIDQPTLDSAHTRGVNNLFPGMGDEEMVDPLLSCNVNSPERVPEEDQESLYSCSSLVSTAPRSEVDSVRQKDQNRNPEANGEMINWLKAKAEQDRRLQEEERIRQEALRLEQLRISEANRNLFLSSISPADRWASSFFFPSLFLLPPNEDISSATSFGQS